MRLGEVIGRVWPERQIDGLAGRTLMQVRTDEPACTLVALDLVGVGVGTQVVVVMGEPARQIADGAPVDAVITAIVRRDVQEAAPPRPAKTK